MRSKTYLILSGWIVVLFIFSIVLIPSGSDAAPNEAIVRVECESWYWGTIKGDIELGVEDMGIHEYSVTGNIISVVIRKGEADNHELKASIIINGAPRVSDSTSEPGGEVRISFNFGILSDDDDDNDGGGSDNSCGSILIVSVLLLGIATIWISRRR